MSALFDRVQESATTTGTGAFTLDAAVTGSRRFGDVCSVGQSVPYCIVRVDANGNDTNEWEVGLGNYSSANTLTRTTVEASSNAGAAVNFAAGNKRVMLTSTATFLASLSKAVVTLLVTDPNASTSLTTGDGKMYWPVPSTLNGYNLVAVAAHVTTVSSSGAPTIQIHNLTQTADMLSTRITIDANEKSSHTAAAAAVIDTANDDVATGDQLRIDVDVAGTGTKGLMVEMQFQLP